MGLYDRDYGRDDEGPPWASGGQSSAPRSITITLIVINVVVYFVDRLSADTGSGILFISNLAEYLAIDGNTLMRPWMWFQFLTYGFLHDINSINHVLFNMIGLFFFGRTIEQRLGRMEFLRFYLLATVLGGIVGAVSNMIAVNMTGTPTYTVGASGAVVAVTILFACYYPQAEILLMFVFPVKAWVLAVFFVAMNLGGAFGFGIGIESNTAFTVHLAGAFFALGYYFRRWNLRWLNLAAIGEIPQRLRQRSRRMKLKLHDPDRKLEQDAAEADRILEKIHREGEESLTSSERKTLERYSRRQREKRGM